MSLYDTSLSWFDMFHLAWSPWGHPDYRWQDFLLSSWQYNISLCVYHIFFLFMLMDPLFSHSVMSDSLEIHGLQHTRLSCHSLLPEFAQIHVHWVDNAIQPSHPPSPPSPALNLSQHQGLFQWVSSSHQVTKVLELQFHHQPFQWIFRVDFP